MPDQAAPEAPRYEEVDALMTAVSQPGFWKRESYFHGFANGARAAAASFSGKACAQLYLAPGETYSCERAARSFEAPALALLKRFVLENVVDARSLAALRAQAAELISAWSASTIAESQNDQMPARKGPGYVSICGVNHSFASLRAFWDLPAVREVSRDTAFWRFLRFVIRRDDPSAPDTERLIAEFAPYDGADAKVEEVEVGILADHDGILNFDRP